MKGAKKNTVDEFGYLFIDEFHQSYPAEVSKAFRAFIKKIGVKKGDYTKVGGNQFGRRGWIPPYAVSYKTTLTYEQGEAILDLFEALCKDFGGAMRKAKNEGIKEGQNLLFQLHSGDITIKQLDEKIKDK